MEEEPGVAAAVCPPPEYQATVPLLAGSEDGCLESGNYGTISSPQSLPCPASDGCEGGRGDGGETPHDSAVAIDLRKYVFVSMGLPNSLMQSTSPAFDKNCSE